MQVLQNKEHTLVDKGQGLFTGGAPSVDMAVAQLMIEIIQAHFYEIPLILPGIRGHKICQPSKIVPGAAKKIDHLQRIPVCKVCPAADKAAGFVKTLGREWFWLGVNLYSQGKPEEGLAAFKADANYETLGATVETISLDCVEQAQTEWQILMAAETTNNLSRFDGVKYGYRTPEYKNIDELYVKSRSESMNFLTKATIIYGSDVLSKGRYENCYDKALRMRKIACDKVREILASYDAILAPACSETSYQAYDILEAFGKVFEESLYTAIPSITGMPAVVTKGVQLIADSFKESVLLSIANTVEGMEA